MRKGIMELIVNNQSVNEIENTICNMEGIEAARIVADKDGIQEVHVLSNNSKTTKQLCRDIESAIQAKHGFDIDYRKISIAQLSKEKEKPEIFRPKIQSVNIESSDMKVRVMVNLKCEDKEYEGIASGPASSIGKIRMVAMATLNAVEKIVSESGHFDLEAISVVQLGSNRIVTSCVTLLSPKDEQVFAGSAIIRDQSENEAIVKSVLNSLNRKFGYC